jgi:hypothetical protein
MPAVWRIVGKMAAGYQRYPALVEFLAYWQRKRGGRAMPRRRDIDPTDIPHLLPHILIVEAVDGGVRYRYRLVGTAIVHTFGLDMTGKHTDETSTGERRAFVREYYDAVRRNRRPAYVRSRYLTRPGVDITANRMLAPLSPDDESVNQIICAVAFDIAPPNETGIRRTDQIDPRASRIELI